METICQSVSVDPRRTTADSMVGRVVAFVLLTRAIGSVLVVLVVLPREKSVVVQVFGCRHDEPSTRSGGRRLKSAKARDRGRWGAVGAAGSTGI